MNQFINGFQVGLLRSYLQDIINDLCQKFPQIEMSEVLSIEDVDGRDDYSIKLRVHKNFTANFVDSNNEENDDYRDGDAIGGEGGEEEGNNNVENQADENDSDFDSSIEED